MDRSSKKCSPAVKVAVLIVAFVTVASAPSKPAYSQVTCYKGNVEEGNYVGELSSVTTPENAGQDCNSFYDDCQGQCLGCIYDADLTEDVCYDNEGRKFLKPD